jgi:hypothetical protein
VFGPTGSNVGAVSWAPVDILWGRSYGPGRNFHPWLAPGLPLACPWLAPRLTLACPWLAPGLPLACPWLAHGLPLACPGLPLACRFCSSVCVLLLWLDVLFFFMRLMFVLVICFCCLGYWLLCLLS